jgi:hypothetical protein
MGRFFGKVRNMKTRRLMGTVIVAALAAAVAAPAAMAAEVNVVDIQQVENQLISAQGMIVQGNLDGGLQALQNARAKAVTADLVARGAFIAKLAEVRMSDRLGDQPKALAALNDAAGQAKLPDQVAAVWQLGLAMAQAAAGKSPATATPVVDFLANGPGPAMKQFGPHVEIARLRIAAGNLGAAEAELRKAAERTRSAQDWSAWLGGLSQLAVAADAGQAPKAGADVFERLRGVANAIGADVDVAEARFLMGRGQLPGVEAILDRAVPAAGEDQILSVLSATYDLALAFQRVGTTCEASRLLNKAETLAAARPVTAAVAALRCSALTAIGQADKAAEVVWKAAGAMKSPQERDQLLAAFGSATVAAGGGSTVVTKLQAAKAGPAVFVAAAGAVAQTGNTNEALKVLGAISPEAVAADGPAASAFVSLMQQIQAQRQQIARDQGTRCRAVAAAFTVAAKAAKDPQAATAATQQAAAMNALAGQVEK